MREWLIQIRKERNMAQAKVAQEAGMTQSFYSNIELGRRGHKLPVDTAMRIANVLDFDWMMFYVQHDKLTPRPETKKQGNKSNKGKR